MGDFNGEHEKAHTKATHPAKAQETAPQTPSAVVRPEDSVLTKWMINYSTVLGKRKDPTRSGADQLIVDELRIQPDAAAPHVLHGGNAARAGRVHLGDVVVPKGSGSVAALVRYGQRSTFTARLSLSSAPTRAERIKLRALEKKVTDRALQEASTEGDYAAIAAKLEAELAGEFPAERALSVEIVPAKSSDDGLAPQEAGYTADGPSAFEVLVEPGVITQHTNTATHGEAGEEGEAQSHTLGTKLTTETATSKKERDARAYQSRFISELSTNVSRAFKMLENDLNDTTKDHVHKHEEKVDWKVGVGPDKGGDKGAAAPSAPAEKSGGDGILSKAWGAISGGAGWVYRRAKGIVKKIPIVRAGLAIAGDIWDTVTGRASVERTSSETEGDTDGNKEHHQSSTGWEIQSLDVIASKLTNEIVTNHEHELETMIAAKFGTEVTFGDKNDKSKKKTVNDTFTTSSTVYEARRPKLVVKKLG